MWIDRHRLSPSSICNSHCFRPCLTLCSIRHCHRICSRSRVCVTCLEYGRLPACIGLRKRVACAVSPTDGKCTGTRGPPVHIQLHRKWSFAVTRANTGVGPLPGRRGTAESCFRVDSVFAQVFVARTEGRRIPISILTLVMDDGEIARVESGSALICLSLVRARFCAGGSPSA